MKSKYGCWSFKILILVTGLAVSLSDCGFKGPLYLPKKHAASSTRSVSSTPDKQNSSTTIKASESSVLNKS